MYISLILTLKTRLIAPHAPHCPISPNFGSRKQLRACIKVTQDFRLKATYGYGDRQVINNGDLTHNLDFDVNK